MNKPSERIVVFVTPAQKRAISAAADTLGISISELMRRAVLAFGATSDQVKAASIVDWLNAPREPDTLAQVLHKATKPLRPRRGSALRLTPSAAPAQDGEPEPAQLAPKDEATAPAQTDRDLAATAAHGGGEADAAQPQVATETQAAALPASPAAGPDIGNATREIGQAVARLSAEAAVTDAAFPDPAHAGHDEPLQSLSAPPVARATRASHAADTHQDEQGNGASEEGKFA
ncbi:hypothetical protein [Paraburkholderia sp.]|uniref:hypothetical protein n=1 Tax=Paraburkholderia sp. TaxID=1926495 RepID=UPI0025D47300|nr:hypothetical protein [Paraburkholderia sp.]